MGQLLGRRTPLRRPHAFALTCRATNPFVQLLPPPNVTGRLHMGHMLNQTEMDILTRWHRMLGDTAVWVPGTDHAGIATQMMVERQLAAEGKTTREQLGREAFTERVWEWKQQYGGAITDQMRRLGASVDWSREYFTMDDRLSDAVKEAFVRLYEQGLIYRGAYIVNWDPVTRAPPSPTSKYENEERAGKLYHIRYPTWPTAQAPSPSPPPARRPCSATVAVAVNPTDERYTNLIGKNAQAASHRPRNPRRRRRLGQPRVRHRRRQGHARARSQRLRHRPAPQPAAAQHHGRNARTSNSPARPTTAWSASTPASASSPTSKPTATSSPSRITPSRIAHLAAHRRRHRAAPLHAVVPRREQDRPTTGGNSIAANAIAAVRDGHIKFTPDKYSKTYFEWMNNIHDWCISRQLWWGHRIPAWHCGACNKITVSLETPGACSGCGITDIRQETDVLDTWFSSGLLPFTVFGWDGSRTTPHP